MPQPRDSANVALVRAGDPGVGGSAYRDRALQRVRRGVYVVGDVWRALQPWERYRLRVEAVALTWHSPVFAYESAAAVLGMPLFGEPRFVHLLDPGGKSRRFGDVVVHGTLDQPPIERHHGMQSTSLLDTTVALARVLPPAFALATANATLRRMAGSSAIDLGAHARTRSARRGLRQLDWVSARASATPESVGESVSLAVIEWLGFEMPECQVEFRYEGRLDRVDFVWHKRTIGESDGYGKYDDEDGRAMKDRFVDEKLREDRLRRHGHPFARWDWSDAIRADPLGDKLDAAGLQQVAPRSHAMLATLAANPRSLSR